MQIYDLPTAIDFRFIYYFNRILSLSLGHQVLSVQIPHGSQLRQGEDRTSLQYPDCGL